MNFSDYQYMPIVRTRASELLGVNMLRDDTKSKILPYASLSRSNRRNDSRTAFDAWNSVFTGPVILGLEEGNRLQLDDYDYLTSPDNDFENWIGFILNALEKNNGVIPSLILNDNISKRQFVKQIQKFEKTFEKFALKINPLDRREVAAASTAASVVDSTESILFILDSGQISRERQKIALDATIHCINELRTIESSIEIVTACTSFPRMFQSYTSINDIGYGEIPMLEWENFHALGGQDVSIYGDYASIHGEFYEGAFARFVARIDYPTPSIWIFQRRQQLAQEEREILYVNAAETIIADENWDDSLDAWGKEIIEQVASGNVDGFKAPGKWISVRLNLHIERIVQFLEQGITIPDTVDFEDGEDDLDW
ncbi:hypothetical protein [Shewanella sp. Iso12]|uniref:beta family protein n=1 Tax=Shewanella sp. Iso12 TaxID=1826753 RepID=UPI00142FE6E9|nr:hypothetical protein [Shewanella sp. Iso12]NJI85521.1 hypothetical protein [Shewanella sp. Iso12]